jgi:hypothetical protein
MPCACVTVHCSLWHIRVYSIFPYYSYLLKSTNLGKTWLNITCVIQLFLQFCSLPSSWSSGQSFWLLISWVRFPVLPWEFFLEGEDSHGGHGLGSSVERRFKSHPGNSYPYITTHFIFIYHYPLHIHISPYTLYPYITFLFISIYHNTLHIHI